MNPSRFVCSTGLFLALFLAPVVFAATDETAVAAVIAAEKARGAALVAADLTQLARLLADDLRYTHSNNKLETKEVFIGTFRNGLGYERFETFDLHGHVIAPDVVVLTGRIDQRKGMNGVYRGNDPKLMFQAVW